MDASKMAGPHGYKETDRGGDGRASLARETCPILGLFLALEFTLRTHRELVLEP